MFIAMWIIYWDYHCKWLVDVIKKSDIYIESYVQIWIVVYHEENFVHIKFRILYLI